jgi:hypothetical protein
MSRYTLAYSFTCAIPRHKRLSGHLEPEFPPESDFACEHGREDKEASKSVSEWRMSRLFAVLTCSRSECHVHPILFRFGDYMCGQLSANALSLVIN